MSSSRVLTPSLYLAGRDGGYLGFFPPGAPAERLGATIRPQLPR